MEFLIFIMYGIIMSEWIYGRSITKKYGFIDYRNFYKTNGIFNIIIGFSGCLLLNIFLRNKDIISPEFFWIFFTGFVILIFTGTYYIYKFMTSMN